MFSMCHYCGAQLTKSNDEKKKIENGGSLKFIGEGSRRCCRICQEKQELESVKRDGLSPYESPMISPTSSLSSSDRTISSCSDVSVDVNSYDRGNREEGTVDGGAVDDFYYGSNGHLQNSRSEASMNRVDRLYKVADYNSKESQNGSDRETVRDVEIIQTINDQETKDNYFKNTATALIEGNEISCSGEDEVDTHIWEPPEAEDPEDDLEGGVAFNDDDDDDDDDENDESGDGTKWGKPSYLSSFQDKGSGSYSFKEEKQKAMEEVINGRFKAVVSQLLKTAGIASLVKDAESWVDIVTSLSWEAASFLNPEAINGKAMDLNGYVKVKCVATGYRNESQLVKGLVFKKRAAHKHMPTKCKNPRFLLIQGMLGQSSNGLSSFKSMEQEKDNIKSLIEMIDVCHPNVVLVEKSVSRDIQESILAKGITLVYDMKLHRLERVARCIGSPILPSDSLTSEKLKQCDAFHIEKFVEEYAALGEGGKKPSKTLMFIEGCPTHLGCTILLKGSHSDELKRIKYVVQIAVIMAYHLILETSFLVDRKAMFSNVLFAGVVSKSPRDQQSSVLGTDNAIIPRVEESTAESVLPTIDIPVSNGFHEQGCQDLDVGLESTSPLSHVPYNPAIFTGFSSLSASIKKVIGDNFPLASAPYQSICSYLGFNGRDFDCPMTEEIPVSKTFEASNHCDVEAESNFDEEKSHEDGQPQSSSPLSDAPSDGGKNVDNNEDQVQSKDDTNVVLDSQSILVLMSRQNASRGIICEQSHFSHIMFYRNFDVPFGKFLQDNLLNQRSQCATCGELPEAHFYYYAHHDKQLTIRVKRLRKILPGEAEGKHWMWSRCGRCKQGKGVPKSTKRVLISAAARSLSFGKFLELSFSHHSLSGGLSSCGHSLERDFLYFFGLGPMGAMFKYSSVTTYTVSLPPLKLEFSHSIQPDRLKQEFQEVYSKGVLLFNGVANTLKKLRSQFAGSTLNLQGSLKEFSEIEDMLKEERSEFELSIHNVAANIGNSDEAVYKFLSLNQLLWELLIESCIWERRLHSMLLSDPSAFGTSATKAVQDQFKPNLNGTADGRNEQAEIIMRSGDKVSDNGGNLKETSDTAEANEFSIKEIPVDGPANESRQKENHYISSSMTEDIESSNMDGLGQDRSSKQGLSVNSNSSSHLYGYGNCPAGNFYLSGDLQVERTIPIDMDTDKNDINVDADGTRKCSSPCSLVSRLENSNGWFWMPFLEIRQIYKKDLQRGFMPKSQSVSGYIQENISAAYQLITEEGSRLHIPLGTNNYIVRDYDGELSSIIACALAFLYDVPLSTEVLDENNSKESGWSAKSTEGLHILTRIPTKISPQWPSNGSLELDSVHSTLSISSEELRFSSFDGLNLLESLVPPENLSPEVSMGVAKSLGKGKYSVICLYAKQFRDLRNRCCPSELDYISSLSRCKNWDAKGGKSKSFFAKTLDDRFIIKEIKKIEFESFMKFAPHYFKYMNESFDSGNQTCLAKVLGIYQVVIRQAKGGKEVRHDLMVMENLTFGRNIERQYDLKGALHARYKSATDGPGDVLLDQNFVNDMKSSPLYVSNKAKRLLERAVWNDTTFLNSINVMDYSLLLGVDTQRQELVCGIIDYLRQYTWDKQLETWVKSSLVVPRNVLPTVISPKEYKKRFRKFMATHFLSVPDPWCSQRSSGPCELCGIRDNGSSEYKSQKQGGLNGFSH